MFLLYSLSLGPPIWPIGVGAPGFSRSEPIVVTPLIEDSGSVNEDYIKDNRKYFDSI
jgi:hypothetical protein